MSDEAKRSEGFFPGRGNSDIRQLPGLASCLDDTIIPSELEIGINIATLLRLLIYFSCVYAIFITGFQSPHFSKEGQKNNLRIETFPAAERRTGSREIQNELLEISLL